MRFLVSTLVVALLVRTLVYSPGIPRMSERNSLGNPATVALPELEQEPHAAQYAGVKPFRFDVVSSDQGLSSSEVWSVLRDQRGFMWFGTLNGLNRFDGYKLKVFENSLTDPTSISDSKVRTLYEDRAGNLWIGTWTGGLNRFDRATETFTRFQHDPKDPYSLSNDGVFAILEGGDGALWLGTRGGGLDHFDPQLGVFSHYRHDPAQPGSLANDSVFALSEEEDGSIWVGTDGGLDRFDPTTKTFTHFRHNPNDPSSLGSDSLRALFRDVHGELWVGTWGGGLSRLQRETGTFVHFRSIAEDSQTLSSDAIFSIDQDPTGALWIGTLGGGLNRLDPQTGLVRRFSQYDTGPGSFGATDVFRIVLVDNRAWFATGNGVFALDLDPKPFYVYQHRPDDLNSIAANEIDAVYEDAQSILWVATADSGLNRIDRATGQIRHFQNDPADPESIGGNAIWGIASAGDGKLWLAGYGSGLDKFDPVTGTAVHFRHDPENPNSLASDRISDVFVDDTGIVWLGTWDAGLDRFDPVSESFTHFSFDPADPASLSDNQIMDVTRGGDGNLWIGTVAGGLNRMDEATGTFTRFQSSQVDDSGLPSNSVNWILFDKAGTLWVATWGGGFARLDPKTGVAVHYHQSDGLPSDTVYAILEDEQGKLWLSTDSGLSRFDPRTETFRNYDVHDGLPSDVFESSLAFRSSTGEMFFGARDGLLAFHPSDIQDNLSAPPIVMTDLLLDNKPVAIRADSVLPQAIDETASLVLSYLDRVISFEFAALNYSNPQKNRYRYMLEGFDRDWTETGSDRRLVTYTNLDPGDYVFRVTGSNDDGIWNETGVALALTVTPPWWETLWFRTSGLLVIGGVIAGGFVWQRRMAEQRQRELETLVTARTRELQDARTQIKTLFDNSPLGICVATYEGSVLAINRSMQRLTGYAEDELLRMNVRVLYAQPEERENVLDRLTTTGALRDYGVQLRRCDGSTFFAILNLSCLRLGDQEVLLGVTDDVTDQVEAHAALSSLNQISYELASTTDLESLTQNGLHHLSEVIDFDRAALMLLEESGESATVCAYPSPTQEPNSGSIYLLLNNWPSLQSALLAKDTTYVPDMLASEAIQLELEGMQPSPWASALQASRSWLALPLRVGERTIALLSILHDGAHHYDASDIGLARTFANQLAVAIDNIHLNEQARSAAAADERSRIARELHDSVTQTLFTASVLAEATPRIWVRDQDIARQNMERLSVLLRGALAEMRSLLLELRSTTTPGQTLDQLLNTLAEATRANSNMTVTLVTDGEMELPAEVTMTFYRIAQEALNNVLKHAEATRVGIEMNATSERVELHIRDDGRGFDPLDISAEHMGISILGERARKIGGDLQIRSQFGRGTDVSLIWQEKGSRTNHA